MALTLCFRQERLKAVHECIVQWLNENDGRTFSENELSLGRLQKFCVQIVRILRGGERGNESFLDDDEDDDEEDDDDDDDDDNDEADEDDDDDESDDDDAVSHTIKLVHFPSHSLSRCHNHSTSPSRRRARSAFVPIRRKRIAINSTLVTG